MLVNRQMLIFESKYSHNVAMPVWQYILFSEVWMTQVFDGYASPQVESIWECMGM